MKKRGIGRVETTVEYSDSLFSRWEQADEPASEGPSRLLGLFRTDSVNFSIAAAARRRAEKRYDSNDRAQI